MKICCVDGCDKRAATKGMCKVHYMRVRANGRPDRPSWAERVWARVNIAGPDECWEWQACREPKGYGRIGVGGPERLAHRAVWFLLNGPIPDGLWVLHGCDNPPCCNPNHLRLGTHADNTADMVMRDRCQPNRGSANSRAKLTEADVLAIRQRAAAGEHYRDIAADFDISHDYAKTLVYNRKRWPHVQVARPSEAVR